MDQTGGQEPVKRETARLAGLPVEGSDPAGRSEVAGAAESTNASADPPRASLRVAALAG